MNRNQRAEELLGGHCSYSSYIGTAEIVKIEKTMTSMEQAKSLGGPGYEGYEIWFSFKAGQQIKEEWARESIKKMHLFRLANSWYPGIQYIEKYKIKVGNTYRCTLKVIQEGTCTPLLFEFDDLKSNDYFEAE